MIGLFIGALIPAAILLLIIKMFTGEDVSFINAFLAALVSGVVSGILVGLAIAPLESLAMIVVVATLIQFVVTAVAVQLICSTDLRHVLMIAGTYACVGLAFNIARVFLLATS
jgi:hypothetical protein